jgi:type II secretory pathway pseudopilin PulG
MKSKKRPVTLIEIMIVIVLIGLIGGVVAYNMRGSLEEGKLFKTRQGGAQVYNILMLEVAKGRPINDVAAHWTEVLEQSTLAKNPKELSRDGWGQPYRVAVADDGRDLCVTSEKYTELYVKQNGTSSRQETWLR